MLLAGDVINDPATAAAAAAAAVDGVRTKSSQSTVYVLQVRPTCPDS